MIISISNAVTETVFVEIILLLALLVSVRRTKDSSFFSLDTTTELRGLAILMVVFSHIGYFLVSDHQFLVPLSNYAGVAVDLFLILSGYGLVAAALHQPLSIGTFYLKRFARVYLPVLITVILFLLMSYFVLNQTYPLKVVVQSMLGFFPDANLYSDLNSPLWYITPLLVYYFLFPLIFWRRFPLFSAAVMAGIGWVVIKNIVEPHISSEVIIALYKLHFLAFPLGMVIGALVNQPPVYLATLLKQFALKFKNVHVINVLRLLLLALAAYIIFYTHHHSGVGVGWKTGAITSLFTSMAILIFFLFKKINFKILSLFGVFSFEVYLLHWPLLYRYNFLYGHIPPGIATIIYLGIFLALGYLYQKVINKIFNITTKHTSLSNFS